MLYVAERKPGWGRGAGLERHRGVMKMTGVVIGRRLCLGGSWVDWISLTFIWISIKKKDFKWLWLKFRQLLILRLELRFDQDLGSVLASLNIHILD